MVAVLAFSEVFVGYQIPAACLMISRDKVLVHSYHVLSCFGSDLHHFQLDFLHASKGLLQLCM